MSATAADIARLRRMVNESGTTTYSDDDLTDYIERHPVVDERGEEPYTWDTSTTPPTQDDNEDWIPTYDLNSAAADIWDEKAAIVAQDFDFDADGGRYNRSQVVEQYRRRAVYYRSRRMPRSIKLVMSPNPGDDDMGWVVNK